MFESNHSQVVTYTLSEEERQEVIQKYGPPTGKHKDIRFTNLIPNWERGREKQPPKLTLDEYIKMKKAGMTELDVIKEARMSGRTLVKLKREWDVPIGVSYKEWGIAEIT